MNNETYKACKSKLIRMNNALDLMQDGVSKVEACKQCRVDVTSIDNLIKNVNNNCTYRAKRIDKQSTYPLWQSRLMFDIFGEDIELCEGFNVVYKYCLSKLNEREQTIIQLRYEEDYTLGDIAKMQNVSRERIRQVERNAIRKFQSTDLRNAFYYGIDYINNMEKMRNNILNQRKSELKKNFSNEGLSSIAIRDLGLSVRAFNSLYRAGFRTVQDIADNASFEKLSKVRNLGKKSIEELSSRVACYGIVIAK